MLCVQCRAASPSSGPPCPECGQTAWLDGAFRLEAEVSTGGRSLGFRGTRMSDRAPVFVKAYRRDLALDETLLEAMKTEARVLGELRHPRLPRLLATVETPTEWARRFHVMELVQGCSWADIAAERRFTPEEVHGMVREVAGVLAELHRLAPAVLHLGLEPRVLVQEGPRTRVLGFGHALDRLPDPMGEPMAGGGPSGYQAPERFEGQASDRADVYALGAIALELLTRTAPRDLLRASDWVSRSRLSEATLRWLEPMLAETPGDRPSAESVARDEQTSPAPTPVAAPRPAPIGLGPLARFRRWLSPPAPMARGLGRSLVVERSASPELGREVDRVLAAAVARAYEVAPEGAMDVLADLGFEQTVRILEDALAAPPLDLGPLQMAWIRHRDRAERGAPASDWAFLGFWLDVGLFDRLRLPSQRDARQRRRLDRARLEAKRAHAGYIEAHPEARGAPRPRLLEAPPRRALPSGRRP